MRAQRPRDKSETTQWLRTRFGLKELRPHQDTVVHALLEGNRVLFVAPTGHGKSLCYQALAAHTSRRGIVLVFQPLKALMQEQVERAQRQQLRAALINSDQSREQQEEVLQAAVNGGLDILFLSPERQGNDLWRERVQDMELKGVVIDEAHCISQWGHDFRPWYRRLVNTVMGLGLRTPVLAMTATAPPQVVEDIQEQITSEAGAIKVIRLPSYRPNLSCIAWKVSGLAARLAALLHIARRRPGQPGIAYLLTTAEADMAADFLMRQGIGAVAYYARGLEADERHERLKDWQQGKAAVICATAALGMGVDRSDVRWVAHLGLPDSLIRYVQEIGRAGRDGAPAAAIAVHDPECHDIYEGLLHSSQPAAQDYVSIAELLRNQVAGRTQIIEQLDIPEMTVQRILDDWVQQGLCARQGKPFEYTWCGEGRSPVPEEAEAALKVRDEFLKDVLAYPTASGCRAILLAEAMGDEELPSSCGCCDHCLGTPNPQLDEESRWAHEYLDTHTPPLRKGKSGSATFHEGGLALSLYGLGRLGTAIKQAKYAKRPAPPGVLDRALEVLRDPQGPYARTSFDAVACLPSTSSGRFVPDFAAKLAERLSIPLIVLEKTRQTELQKKFRSRHLKQRNVRGAFRLPPDTRVPERLLLVDDIWDSGESLLAAAKVLSAAADVRPIIHVLTMARTRHTDDS
jgi:ATP-dependent DNA helicase RecQ